jgi:hypothetical protein
MKVTVEIPDELEAQARDRGLRVESYVEEILAQKASIGGAATTTPRTSVEVRSWLDSLAQFSDKIPALPEVISRDWLYEGHN